MAFIKVKNMQKRSICLIISNIGGKGGTERMTFILAEMLSKFGFNVHILSLIAPNEINHDFSSNIQIDFILKEKRGNIGKYFFRIQNQIRAYVKCNHINTIICVDTMNFIFTLYAQLTRKVDVIAWEHFNFNVNFNKKIRKFSRFLVALFAYKVVTLTQRDKLLWEKNWFCRTDIVCIPNPVIQLDESNHKEKWEPLFIAIGRLTYQKGFDRLLGIWQKVSPSLPDWYLNIIGDGEDKKVLEDYISNNHLPRVKLIPFSNEVNQFYYSASALLMTSRFEGLPMVLLEAAESGLPAIAYDCETGPAEVIIDGENGFLIDEGDEQKFVNRMTEFANNRELQKTMSIKAEERCAHFSLDEISKKWLELLDG